LLPFPKAQRPPGIKIVAIGEKRYVEWNESEAQRAGNLLGLVVLQDKRVAVQGTAEYRQTAVDADVVETKAIAYWLETRDGAQSTVRSRPLTIERPRSTRCSRSAFSEAVIQR
jgi:hypothetical protein